MIHTKQVDRPRPATGGLLREGARAVLLHPGVFWLLYGTNLALSVLATLPMTMALSRAFGGSLASNGLSNGMDLGLLFEIHDFQGLSMTGALVNAFAYGALFLLFTVATSGGVLQAYSQDSRLRAEQFFQASGAFFWRSLRLMLCFIPVMGVLAAINGMVGGILNKVTSEARPEQVGIYARWALFLLMILLVSAVKLWFDMAQVHSFCEGQFAVRRSLWQAAKITLRYFPRLYWMFVRAGIAGAVMVLLMLVVVTQWAPSAVAALFLQLGLMALMASRLWQRAAEVRWYQRTFPAEAAALIIPAPVPVTMDAEHEPVAVREDANREDANTEAGPELDPGAG